MLASGNLTALGDDIHELLLARSLEDIIIQEQWWSERAQWVVDKVGIKRRAGRHRTDERSHSSGALAKRQQISDRVSAQKSKQSEHRKRARIPSVQ